MRTGRCKVAISIVFICLLFAVFWFPSVKAQGEGNAKFTQVEYQASVPSGAADTWTFTILNINCSENGEDTAQFFYEFYVDGSLFFNEYNSTTYRTWNCTKGQKDSNSYEAPVWSDSTPVTHDLKAELYWFENGTVRLEDTATFTVGVTVFMSLQNIYCTSYLALYLIACFLLLLYDYVLSLEE